MLRGLSRYLSTLMIAFILAVVVWVSASLSTDPNEERVYPRDLDLEVLGLDPGMVQTLPIPSGVRLTLNAPLSIWEQLNSNQNSVRAWVDLSGLPKGDHTIPVQAQVGLAAVRITKVEPLEVDVHLESFVTRAYTVTTNITGEPALGYRRGTATLEPEVVSISGPESLVERVVETRVSMDMSGANDSIRRNITVQALDEQGASIQGITISPATVSLSQPVRLLGGYRNVVVKVVTTGEVASGYWLTNISVSPPNVTVFSTNPQLVNALPGYVESNPLDISNLADDVDIRATLNLPEGVTLAGEESVLVRLSIAALEGSLPITLPLEIVGLPPELFASISPDSVEVLLTGPLPILNNLNPAGIRISINLSGLVPGDYQVTPVVDLLPNQIQVASILPEEVLVTISDTPPTPTPTAQSGSAVVVPTPTVTPRP